MSGNERPEERAFTELETLVRHLGEELAAFRRRAISAEAQLREAGHAPRDPNGQGRDRLTELEGENDALRKRVARAEDQVRQMLDRVRFLRQQLHAQTTAGASR
jgi:predicted  nucleic acid-binding Zn-ribbon protein